MKDRIVAVIALVVAIGAVSYTGWLHHHSKRLAEQAVREREINFLRANVPRIKVLYGELLGDGTVGFDSNKFDPQTLEEMFYPFLLVFQRMQGTPE